MSYLFLDWLFDCYCVRGPLRLVLKINLLEKGWLQAPEWEIKAPVYLFIQFFKNRIIKLKRNFNLPSFFFY